MNEDEQINVKLGAGLSLNPSDNKLQVSCGKGLDIDSSNSVIIDESAFVELEDKMESIYPVNSIWIGTSDVPECPLTKELLPGSTW